MWTAFLFSVSTTISLSMVLVFCLCWKKKSHKNDLLGLDGMVTQKNPDENVNHLPSVDLPACAVNANANTDETDTVKRNVVTSNTRRSLPDIPSEQQSVIHWEGGDNSSEHYATLGQYRNSKKSIPPVDQPKAGSSILHQSSIGQADDGFSPYEKIKYDKIKLKEHSYAQVHPTTSRQVIQEESSIMEERGTFLMSDNAGTITESSEPLRSRRTSNSSDFAVDIPAASAVAGGIAASPDLPYMTPPVHQTQSNFSGDSQDSSKGYTSICVREPLANLLTQTREVHKKQDLDPHYSTVSDDSDDVYTTIQDSNQVYTSESETYARIPAHPITVEAEINPSVLDDKVNNEPYEQLTNHSRQASGSSSVANIGSPKPEKRQANSPLPPPPTAGSSFEFHLEKLHRNLDDLYAKVHKTKKEESEKPTEKVKNLETNCFTSLASTSDSNENTSSEEIQRKPKEHNYEKLRTCKQLNPSLNDIFYEKKDEFDSLLDLSPGYEVLKNQSTSSLKDPTYEELVEREINKEDGYSVVKKVNKVRMTADNDEYEILCSYDKNISVSDEPNYESMPSESVKSAESESDPNYESVNQILTKQDPNLINYEQIRSNRGYENLDTSRSSSSGEERGGDGNYEQLLNKDYDLSYNDSKEFDNSIGPSRQSNNSTNNNTHASEDDSTSSNSFKYSFVSDKNNTDSKKTDPNVYMLDKDNSEIVQI